MHPFLIKIGAFSLPSYGVMIMLGVMLCVWMALRRARTLGINPDDVYDLAFWALVSGFVGARLLFIIVGWRDFIADPLSMILSRSGFVFLGGLLGAIPVVFVVIRRKNLEMWNIADIAAPSILVAHAFGRIGCFLAGCCYGGVCPENSFLSFLAVRFPVFRDASGAVEYSMSYHDHLARGLIDPLATHSAPVYPSQLFESATNLLIMAVLLVVWRRRAFMGQIFSLYLMLYGAARFLLEFARGDADRGFLLGLSTSQAISIGLIAAGCVIFVIRRGTPIVPGPTASPAAPSTGRRDGGGEVRKKAPRR